MDEAVEDGPTWSEAPPEATPSSSAAASELTGSSTATTTRRSDSVVRPPPPAGPDPDEQEAIRTHRGPTWGGERPTVGQTSGELALSDWVDRLEPGDHIHLERLDQIATRAVDCMRRFDTLSATEIGGSVAQRAVIESRTQTARRWIQRLVNTWNDGGRRLGRHQQLLPEYLDLLVMSLEVAEEALVSLAAEHHRTSHEPRASD